MTASLESLTSAVEALDTKLSEHIRREEQQRMDAYPFGDVHGHRKAHEAMMEAAQAQAKFYNELRIDLAKKGLWTLLAITAGLFFLGLAAKFGLTIKP